MQASVNSPSRQASPTCSLKANAGVSREASDDDPVQPRHGGCGRVSRTMAEHPWPARRWRRLDWAAEYEAVVARLPHNTCRGRGIRASLQLPVALETETPNHAGHPASPGPPPVWRPKLQHHGRRQPVRTTDLTPGGSEPITASNDPKLFRDLPLPNNP